MVRNGWKRVGSDNLARGKCPWGTGDSRENLMVTYWPGIHGNDLLTRSLSDDRGGQEATGGDRGDRRRQGVTGGDRGDRGDRRQQGVTD